MSDNIEAIGVVGAGVMGAGIAEICARSGRDVVVVEREVERLADGETQIIKSLTRAVDNGKLDQNAADRALAGIRLTERLEELSDRDLVIEAVTEDEQVKVGVFQRIDQIVARRDAILASNTSSIPVIRLGMATRRQEQVIGLHFFNPVPVLDLVEIVPSLLTSEETQVRTHNFAVACLGKEAITSRDRAGFVVNALLIPFVLSAIRMLESGFASATDIDTGFVQGAAHPMGPLALADFIGLDTVLAVSNSLYDELKEPYYAPPPLLLRMAEGGMLGRKTGHGFFQYSSSSRYWSKG